MKTLSLKLNKEALNLAPEDATKSDAEIVSSVVENVILGYANQVRGLDEKERRQFYKISDALDEAKKNKAETVQFEDEWSGFIKKCFKEAKLMPNKLLKQIEDIINESLRNV